MDSTTAIEESSTVSYLLDQEEYTITFDEATTLDTIKNQFQTSTYTEIEFSCCAPVSVEKLCEAIPTVNPNLKSLIVRDTPWLNDECLEVFTAYCCKLYRIELQGCLTEITRSGIESIGRNCSSLLSLSIVSRNKDNREYRDDDQADDSAFGKYFENEWKLDNRIFPALINNMNCKLRHFALSGFSTFTVDALVKFLSYFRQTLQSIDFSHLSIIENEILKSLGDYCENLFVVKLNYCSKITDAGINNLMSKLNNIEELELCGCNEVTDKSCERIAKSCPKLTVIKLDACLKLTERSLDVLSSKCQKLSAISMRQTALTRIPCSVARLKYLNYLNVDGCRNLKHPSGDVIAKGVSAIQARLHETNLLKRMRCFLLGSAQSGKTSIASAVKGEAEITDDETFGVPVSMWYPLSSATGKCNDDLGSWSLELWDCSGRKALEGIHSFFMNRRTVYVVCFNLTIYTSIDKVIKWVTTIQAKAPGSFIVIAASHSDLSTAEKTKVACERVMNKLVEQENRTIHEIKEELLFLRDLGLFSMIGAKRRKLEWLLENRPRIHNEVVVLSSITGKGIDELQNIIITATVNKEIYPPYKIPNKLEQFYFRICNLKRQNIIIVRWTHFIEIAEECGIDLNELSTTVAPQLESLGCIMEIGNYVHDSPFESQSSRSPLNDDDDIAKTRHHDSLLCINPSLFADAIAFVHRNDSNVQDLVNTLERSGYIDALWPSKKPYEWTLRNTFTNITQNGMVRESIIPLLLYKFKLPMDQFQLIIEAMRKVYALVSGAPNASYNVELVIPNLKEVSVYKRYYLPNQGVLPVIPQVNAWLPNCPETHVQVGWHYRFVSSMPPSLFLILISACTTVIANSEVLSYWQAGTYIRNGDINVCVCQWKDKLVLQVLARVKNVNGSRQAVNRAWCCLSKYLYEIENILAMYPGLYYEVLAVSNTQYKPVLEIMDEYEAGDVNENKILWYIPLIGCTHASRTRSTSGLVPNYFSWLKAISDQSIVHISHSSHVTSELRPLVHYLTTAGYEVTTDAGGVQAMTNARIIICLLDSQYFEEDKLASVRNNLKNKKLFLATFEQGLSTDNRGHEDILLNNNKVDISGGKGTASSYQPDVNQLISLVDSCNTLVFGHGSLGKEVNHSGSHRQSLSNAEIVRSPTSTKKPFDQFSDIVKQFSNMSQETEMRHVARTAVAAAVAMATAEHIAKQSNPTMGAKAAAMAAVVADAVAKGDTERAAQAVIATARSVDEVVAFSNIRQSVTQKPNNADANNTRDGKHASRPKSAMCAIV